MTKQKVGLVIFWASVTWMITWVIVGGSSLMPLMRYSTTEEINLLALLTLGWLFLLFSHLKSCQFNA